MCLAEKERDRERVLYSTWVMEKTCFLRLSLVGEMLLKRAKYSEYSSKYENNVWSRQKEKAECNTNSTIDINPW